MSSSFILFLNPPIHHHHKPLPLSSSISSSSSHSSFSHSLTFNSHLCFSSSSNPSHGDREEQKWLREEQRWLREEQRWLREEQRWARERDSLLRQISDLQFRIRALERQVSIQGGASSSDSETIATIAGLLQVLKDKSLIADMGSSSSPMVLEGKKSDEEEGNEEVAVEKEIRVSDGEGKKVEKKKSSLRMGSEGEEVRAMQVCYLPN